jgi:hypothetical protein
MRVDSAPDVPVACVETCNGTCSNGACLVTVTSLAGAGPTQIAVDGTNVYWVAGEATSQFPYASVALMKVLAAGGGTPVTFASGQNNPLGPLVVAGDNLYWTNAGSDYVVGGGEVVYRPLAGGEAVTLAVQQAGPVDITVDATSVYWIDRGSSDPVGTGAAIMRVALGGGTPVTLSDLVITNAANDSAASFGAAGFAASTTSLYWGDNGYELVDSGGPSPTTSGGAIVELPLGGGLQVTLASWAQEVGAIVTDSTAIYWTKYGPPVGSTFPDGAVMRLPLDGGTPVTVVGNQLFIRAALAVDTTSVYWTTGDNMADGHDVVMRLALAGGAPVTLATKQAAPQQIVADGTSIYWSNLGTQALVNGYMEPVSHGSIMKLTPSCACR